MYKIGAVMITTHSRDHAWHGGARMDVKDEGELEVDVMHRLCSCSSQPVKAIDRVSR